MRFKENFILTRERVKKKKKRHFKFQAISESDKCYF